MSQVLQTPTSSPMNPIKIALFHGPSLSKTFLGSLKRNDSRNKVILVLGKTSTSVGTWPAAAEEDQEVSCAKEKIFTQESDASNFLKKHDKRSPKPPGEVDMEKQKLQAEELWREYYEEQRNKFEKFVEEQNDEQEERSQEAIEQWRQWHYDGLYPSYIYNRHHV
ncbi:LOW QUALITY PROTEIN: putative cartilage matrix-associated protein [Trichechus inunguis]